MEMNTFCETDCCAHCSQMGRACPGCEDSDGHPCGGRCFVAELVKSEGLEAFTSLKRSLIAEINALGVSGLHVSDLNLPGGAYINLAYPLPSGCCVPFLDDKSVYLGNQIEGAGEGRCFGVVADPSFVLVCTYGENGKDPELLLYKRTLLTCMKIIRQRG